MTRREYAISLGLAVPGRGRLSAKAHEAINKAEREGMKFSDSPFTPSPRPVHTHNVLPKIIQTDDIPADPKHTFEETVTFKGVVNGKTVVVDGRQVCSGDNGCGYSLWYCRCPIAITASRSTLSKYGRVNVEPVFH